jgi:hypothetical protein
MYFRRESKPPFVRSIAKQSGIDQDIDIAELPLMADLCLSPPAALGRLQPITIENYQPIAEYIQKIAEHFTFSKAIKNPVDH